MSAAEQQPSQELASMVDAVFVGEGNLLTEPIRKLVRKIDNQAHQKTLGQTSPADKDSLVRIEINGPELDGSDETTYFSLTETEESDGKKVHLQLAKVDGDEFVSGRFTYDWNADIQEQAVTYEGERVGELEITADNVPQMMERALGEMLAFSEIPSDVPGVEIEYISF